VTGRDLPGVPGSEGDLTRFAEDSHPGGLRIDLQDDRFDPFRHECRGRFGGRIEPEQRGAVAHHVGPGGGVGLARLVLAGADGLLEVAVGGHRLVLLA
jgi:hypothetical protein